MVTSPQTTLVFELPRSTAECDLGPIAELAPGRACLRYDSEGEEEVLWTTLRFTGVLAAVFTPEVACESWMTAAFSRVCRVSDSDWMERLSSTATSRGALLPARANHFFIFFDHVGCWEVLAEVVELAVEDDAASSVGACANPREAVMENTVRLLVLAAEDFTGLWDAALELAHEPSAEEAARRALQELLTGGHIQLFTASDPALQAPVELGHEEVQDALAPGPQWSVPGEGTEGELVYFAATEAGIALIRRLNWGHGTC